MSGSTLKSQSDDVHGNKEVKEFFEVDGQKVKIPSFIGQTCLSILVFIMGASMRGNFDSNYFPFFVLGKSIY